jgi:hypothetical protein
MVWETGEVEMGDHMAPAANPRGAVAEPAESRNPARRSSAPGDASGEGVGIIDGWLDGEPCGWDAMLTASRSTGTADPCPTRERITPVRWIAARLTSNIASRN